MNKTRIYPKVIVFLLCLFLISCNQEQQTDRSAPETRANTDIVAADPELVEEGVLHKVEKKHQFSSPGKQDTFELLLEGETPVKGRLTLKITSAAGQVIYSDTFNGNLMLDYAIRDEAEDTANITDAEINDYIIKKMNSFFSEEQFFKVSEKQAELIPEHLIQENWKDIKDKDKQGFYYSIGEEDLRYIAFSDSQGKAVMYYNCC